MVRLELQYQPATPAFLDCLRRVRTTQMVNRSLSLMFIAGREKLGSE